jgi:Fe-S cluster assembly protein SufD
MTAIAIAKTKAEDALARAFDQVAERLPGGRAVAEARRSAIGTFQDLGLPHRRVEEWKYSDLRNTVKDAPSVNVAGPQGVTRDAVASALRELANVEVHRLVFVDGTYRADFSDTEGLKGLEITTLAQALGKPGVGLMHDNLPGHASIVALNTAFVTDGAVIKVAQGMTLSKPLLLVYVRASTGALLTTRNIMSFAADSTATVIEAHVTLGGVAGGQDNAMSEVTIGEGARITHVKAALAGAGQHLGTWLVTLGRSSVYRGFQMTAETAFTRNTTFLTYTGEDAKADISGVFLARGNEHVDTTLVIDHAVPQCESRELFKGVLDGRGRGVFQGKVIVRPDAQKSDGKQMAQALMLSEDAEFDSKPELEIFADDVVCGHGSTCAEIDDDQLFYMRARGIDKDTARALLIESFVAEAIEKVEHAPLRDALQAVTIASLQRKA